MTTSTFWTVIEYVALAWLGLSLLFAPFIAWFIVKMRHYS